MNLLNRTHFGIRGFRHPRESGDPGFAGTTWIPACAGMTFEKRHIPSWTRLMNLKTLSLLLFVCWLPIGCHGR